MKRGSLRPIAALLAGAMLVSACTTTGGTPVPDRPLTPQEQAMRARAKAYESTKLEGALLGCLLGGGLGLLTGMAMSDNTGKGAATGALAGCAAGGLGGFAYGSYIAEKQEQYATAELQYASMLEDARIENERLSGFVDISRQVMADDVARLDEINERLATGTISLENARQEVAVIDQNRAQIESSLEGLKEKEAELLEIRAQAASLGTMAQRAQMDTEIEVLQRQIGTLQEDLAVLVERRKVSRVG